MTRCDARDGLADLGDRCRRAGRDLDRARDRQPLESTGRRALADVFCTANLIAATVVPLPPFHVTVTVSVPLGGSGIHLRERRTRSGSVGAAGVHDASVDLSFPPDFAIGGELFPPSWPDDRRRNAPPTSSSCTRCVQPVHGVHEPVRAGPVARRVHARRRVQRLRHAVHARALSRRCSPPRRAASSSGTCRWSSSTATPPPACSTSCSSISRRTRCASAGTGTSTCAPPTGGASAGEPPRSCASTAASIPAVSTIRSPRSRVRGTTMSEFPKIISVDDHVVEPAHLWQDRLPARDARAGRASSGRGGATSRSMSARRTSRR